MGVYAYGVEEFRGERVKTFELALRLMKEGKIDLRPLVTHRFALGDYKRAIRTALGELEQASHAMAQHLYRQQGSGGAGAQPAGDGQQGADKGKEDVIDAEFEVKK